MPSLACKHSCGEHIPREEAHDYEHHIVWERHCDAVDTLRHEKC